MAAFAKMHKLFFAILTIFMMLCVNLRAQYNNGNDPASREDAAIERKKILRAADQIDDLIAQVNSLQSDLKSMREELSVLRSDNQSLRQQLSQSEMQRAKEKDVILTEVAKQVESSNKKILDATTLANEKRAAAEEKEKNNKTTVTPAEKQEGYEHTVEAGQTLWLISKAYRDKGVNVSVDDIRKANNLKSSEAIHKGQKLFIPQK